MKAFKLARKYVDCQLVLAGGGASDDPEGAVDLKELKEAVGCVYQIRYLLTHPEFAAQLGENGREHVKEIS